MLFSGEPNAILSSLAVEDTHAGNNYWYKCKQIFAMITASSMISELYLHHVLEQ